jgi:hypothetical protein
MFSPLILMCAGACIALSGPTFSTEEACIKNIQEQGIQIVLQRYPGFKIVDATCYEWPSDA